MSKNPTALKVGMSGQLRGRRYTVRGWVVYSVEIDGEKYYWTEFNVADANGLGATLVFEETEDGPTWKWFTLLEPRRPLTIAEAEAKKVGDTVEYEGRQIPITLVDESYAEEIEGEPPGNVAWHETARYFNADAGQQRLFVATWVNGKIEFYIGQTIGRRLVESAFGLPRMAGYNENYSAPVGSSIDWEQVKAAVWIIGLISFFLIRGCYENYDPDPNVVFAAAPAMKPAPAQVVPAGARGAIAGQSFAVTAHAKVAVLQPRARFEVREYRLRGDDGREALLVHGWEGGANHWLLLESMEMPAKFDAWLAARVRSSTNLAIGDQHYTVTNLLLARAGPIDGDATGAPWSARDQYGFLARRGDEWLLCRWDETRIFWFKGRLVAPAALKDLGVR
ncbi:MAG: DUF4178 domain-containing protein [Opitutae bacterium]|nr:DUF4178 domain-containing protein [Opitutae bacterium]